MATKHGTNPSLIEVEPSAVSDALQGLTTMLNQPKVSPTNGEEVKKRIADYFKHCEETGLIPTIEGVSLALGVSRSAVWRWSKGEGCSYETMQAVQEAKTFLSALDAQLVLTGKINPVSYIFRSKNFYGMQDAVRIEADTNPQRIRPLEEISARYQDLVSVDPKERLIEE